MFLPVMFDRREPLDDVRVATRLPSKYDDRLSSAVLSAPISAASHEAVSWEVPSERFLIRICWRTSDRRPSSDLMSAFTVGAGVPWVLRVELIRFVVLRVMSDMTTDG